MLLTDRFFSSILHLQSRETAIDLYFKEVLSMTTIYDVLAEFEDGCYAVSPLAYVALNCAR